MASPSEMSSEYLEWKKKTLAMQTGHLEVSKAVHLCFKKIIRSLFNFFASVSLQKKQSTGLWKDFQQMKPKNYREKDKNSFVIEIAPGHR